MATLNQFLYHSDSYRNEFDARIIDRRTVDGKPAVVLDGSYFYPASGGQPCDTGTINDLQVTDVIKDGDCILHILTEDLTQDTVHCKIDWHRRFDHMQQHTGQHILSRVLIDLFDAHTVSFHMGEDLCSIDTTSKPGSDMDWDKVQFELHEAVRQNVTITSYTIQPEEAESLAVRRVPEMDGPLRIVDIEGIDRTACGGTHCGTSGEVGVIQLVNRSPRRVHGDHFRIEFLCGNRAFTDYSHKIRLIKDLSLTMDARERDLLDGIIALKSARKSCGKELSELKSRLANMQSGNLVDEIDERTEPPILKKIFDDKDPDELRKIAQTITAKREVVALLGCVQGKSSLVFARSDGLPYDMGELMKSATMLVGGRGGGKAHIAMGGVPDHASLIRAIDDAVKTLRPTA
ncbi:MAG: hypothetical protein HOH43_08640 [Candidatus Latescibacteria bacterium]|nr:hypothetical protein [Candidatus Latescibacterota bacterium]